MFKRLHWSLLARFERRKVMGLLVVPGAALALSGCPNEDLAPLAPCTVSGVSDEVPVTGVDKVDLLFMIDDSGSMAQEQAKLADQLPKLVRILTSGRREGGNCDGATPDPSCIFTPVSDLHVGVVTSDMGLNGSKIKLPPSCEGFGDDGILKKKNAGCDSNVPAGYLSYVPGKLAAADRDSALNKVIADFTCLAHVGTVGCGFEQQLEAPYKAVAPKSVVFSGNSHGHGDAENKGFLRPEAVLAMVLVSDEEDCSVTDKGAVMFDDNTNAPGVKLPGSSMNLGLNIRCAYTDKPEGRETQAEQNGYVYDVDRYVTELKKNVKPLNPDRIIFAAITGIAEETEGKSFDEMLKHPRMDFAVDPTTGGGDPTNRNTAARDVCRRCVTASAAECLAKAPNLPDGTPDPDIVTGAKPAVRFVKVAKAYGDNGVVQSICAESFAPAVDTIIEKISKQLTGACLPRELNPNADGIVECNVVEILGPDGTEADCSADRGRVFLERRAVGMDQRVVCSINQVAVQNEMLVANPSPLMGVSDGKVGWYYDTFTPKLKMECPEGKQRRISFTEGAEPKDATVRFECFQPVVSSNTEVLGKEAVNSPCASDADCDSREDHGSANDGFDLRCDSTVKTCQISCGQDSECPPSWVCNGNAMQCVNPTCPPPSLR